MYQDAKKIQKARRYSSISELIRDLLRGFLYPRLTENGFTPEFEAEVLKSAAEPVDNDIVLKTEKDVDDYFNNLKLPPEKKHAKS